MVIYKIKFPNNKVYIGKSINFKMRKYHHIRESRKFNNLILYKAIRKYGIDNIEWEIIYECSSKEEMSLKEIEFIKYHNSTSHEFGYNMVCGDKECYKLRDNFDKEYMTDIVKKKLKSNGHDPDNYITIDDNLLKIIKNEYLDNKLGLRTLSKKYKISRQRITRLLKSENIKIDSGRCSITNGCKLSDIQINSIIEKYKSGLSIKDISSIDKLTILIVSRTLHDSGIRKSKRFKDGKRYDGRQPKKRINNYKD